MNCWDNSEFERLLGELAAMPDRIEEQVRTVPASDWERTAHPDDGWNRHQLLAHIASNDLRQFTRLRLGAGMPAPGDEQELEAMADTDAWNGREVLRRQGSSVADLLQEMHRHRNHLVAMLRTLSPEQHARIRIMRRDQSLALLEWFALILEHDRSHVREIVD
ncbi:MAG: DinB family protein [Dehalococcoidia bacterium]